MDAENCDGTFPYECSICSIRFQLMNDAKFHYENEHQNLSKKIKAESEGIATENNTNIDNIVSDEADEIKTEPMGISNENKTDIDSIESDEATEIKTEPKEISTEYNTDIDSVESDEAAEIKTEPEEISTKSNTLVRFTEYIDNIDGIETEETAEIKTEPEGISTENNRIVRFTEYIDNIDGIESDEAEQMDTSCQDLINSSTPEPDMDTSEGQTKIRENAAAQDKKKHECGVCGKLFKSKYNLKFHMKKSHEGSLAQNTKQIGVVPENVDTEMLKSILRSTEINAGQKEKVNEEKKHECSICLKSFKLKYNLKFHFKRAHEKRVHQIRNFYTKIENLPKIEKKSKSIFDTILSDGNEDTSDNNKENQSDDSKSDTNENEAEETEQHMDRPSWHFDVLPEPNREEQHHEKTENFKCSLCSKSFQLDYYLKLHMEQVHAGVKPHGEYRIKKYEKSRPIDDRKTSKQDSTQLYCPLCIKPPFTKQKYTKSGLEKHIGTVHEGVNAKLLSNPIFQNVVSKENDSLKKNEKNNSVRNPARAGTKTAQVVCRICKKTSIGEKKPNKTRTWDESTLKYTVCKVCSIQRSSEKLEKLRRNEKLEILRENALEEKSSNVFDFQEMPDLPSLPDLPPLPPATEERPNFSYRYFIFIFL